MYIEFYEDSPGKSPPHEEIGNNPQFLARVTKRLEVYERRTFEELWKSGEIEKIKVPNKNKIHELRMDIGKGRYRFLFVYRNNRAYLLRFVHKKEKRIKPGDVGVADNRADKIPQ